MCRSLAFLVFIVFLLIQSAVCEDDLGHSIPESELNALVDFFDTTNGNGWIRPWNLSADPCIQPGIICDDTNVLAIQLGANNLRGSIPSSIGNLSKLQIVELFTNFLEGTLPDAFYTLQELHYIDMAENFFSGTISPLIRNLKSVSHLDFGTNFFTNVPDDIGHLTQLVELFLDDIPVSDPIPDGIYNLTGLEILILQNGHYSGTVSSHIGNLKNLQMFSVANVFDLQGTIPEEFYDMVSLEQVFLGSTQITGTISTRIGRLTSLEFLDISFCDLQGTIPSEIGETSIQQLFLEFNSFEGSISKSIGNLQNLNTISLIMNKFSGTLPETFWSIRTLASIQLSVNQFEGTLSNSINSSSNLRELFLTSNRFSGSLPPVWPVSLTKVDLSANRFSGSIPEGIWALPQCDDLELTNNQLTGTISEAVEQMTSVQILNLGTNSLEGPMPDAIGTLEELLELTLANNQLTGTIVEGLLQNSVQRLNLENNKFSGRIPGDVTGFVRDDGTFASLVSLLVAGNNLYGPNLPKSTFSNDEFITDTSTRQDFPREQIQCAQVKANTPDSVLLLSIDPQYYDYKDCACMGNMFWKEIGRGLGPINGSCFPCPSNDILCDNTVAASPNHTIAQGFYGFSPTSKQQVVTGDELLSSVFIPCFPEDICLQTGCKEGHEGFACSKCSKNFYLQNFHCIECPHVSAFLFILVDVIAVIGFFGYLWKTACAVQASAKVTILIFYLHLLSVLKIAGLYSPGTNQNDTQAGQVIFNSLGLESLATFNPTAFDCVVTYGFVEQFWVLVTFGISALVLVGVLFCVQKGITSCIKRIKTKYFPTPALHGQSTATHMELDVQYLKWKSIYCYLIDLAYFPTVAACLAVFKCVTSDGVSFLQIAPFISCESQSYKAMFPAAVVCLVIYGLGVRLYFGLSVRREYTRAGSVQSLLHLSFLWAPMKDSRYWWTVTIVPLRKISISAYLLFDHTSIVAPVIVFAVVLSTLLLQIRVKPYKNNTDNLLEIISTAVVLIVYQVAFLEAIGGGTLTDTNIWIFIQTVDIVVKVIFVLVIINGAWKSRRKTAQRSIATQSEAEYDDYQHVMYATMSDQVELHKTV